MTSPKITNLNRAMWAESALCAFDEQVRVEGFGSGLRAMDAASSRKPR